MNYPEGELEDLIEEFNDGKVQFAFVKVRDPNSGLPKFVLIAWVCSFPWLSLSTPRIIIADEVRKCGEGVPEMVKGYFNGHLNAASKVLHVSHTDIYYV